MRRTIRKIRRFLAPKAPPAPPPLSRHQYKETWNGLAETQDSAKMAVSGYVDESLYATSGENFRDLLRETVGLEPDDVILEIGAGVGRSGAALAPICRRWIGTDVSPKMIGYMRERLAGHDNVELVEVSGFDLAPIPSATVDLVYCTIVFMHLEEWDRYAYVREAFRVLKPGGRLFIDNVNVLSEGGWKFFEFYTQFSGAQRPPQISKTSTPQELENYCRRAGFTDVRLRDHDILVIAHAVKPSSPA